MQVVHDLGAELHSEIPVEGDLFFLQNCFLLVILLAL